MGSSKLSATKESFCQVCRKSCKAFRCTRCRNAWYCSTGCQTRDWKAGHRKTCGTSMSGANGAAEPSLSPFPLQLNLKAHSAMIDLQALLVNGNYSMDDLRSDYYNAKDQVERLRTSNDSGAEKKKKKVSTKRGGSNGGSDMHAHDKNKNRLSVPQNAKLGSTCIEKPEPSQGSNFQSDDVISLARLSTKTKIITAPASSFWDFWIENLTHISCYQVVVRPKANHLDGIASITAVADSLDFQVIVSDDQQSSIVSLRQRSTRNYQTLFRARLPGKVQSMPSAFQVQEPHDHDQGHKGGSLNLRLQYLASFEQRQQVAGESLLSSDLSEFDANNLCCKLCQLPLLFPNRGNASNTGAVIERVVPAPSSNWDDIADYLICFSGQATFDFTTASTNVAQVGVALVDTNAIVLHPDDVGTSVCVLAAEGYGEQSATMPFSLSSTLTTSPFASAAAELGNDAPAVVRGPRSWREAVGGGSICCSQCCAVLGFASLASPKTYRFLKHRVAILSPVTACSGESGERKARDTVNSMSLCCKPLMNFHFFIAHEMIRYAETKAIFTFIVERGKVGRSNSDGSALPHKRRRLLLLKLLSWDSQFVTSKDASFLEDDSHHNHLLQDVHFRNTAKIFFEETWLDSNDTSNYKSGDISSWIWGGSDLCCLPGSTRFGLATEPSDRESTKHISREIEASSSVRLLLEEDEWDELKKSLRDSSKYFSKEIVEATLAAKIGKRMIPNRTDRDRTLGLSLVPLSI